MKSSMDGFLPNLAGFAERWLFKAKMASLLEYKRAII